MLTLIFGLGVFAVSLIFRLAHKLRLTIPLLYFLAAPTLLRNWYMAHPTLAAWILYALLALVAISWVYSLVRVLREALGDRAAEAEVTRRFAERVRQARANGESVVSTEGLW